MHFPKLQDSHFCTNCETWITPFNTAYTNNPEDERLKCPMCGVNEEFITEDWCEIRDYYQDTVIELRNDLERSVRSIAILRNEILEYQKINEALHSHIELLEKRNDKT